MGNEPRWLHIGLDNEQSLELLDRLANDDELRRRLESDPREVLLKEFRIDFPAAPDSVRLPPRDTIQQYADELRKEQPFGRDVNLPHGIYVLYLAHGNGWHRPHPWPDPDSSGGGEEIVEAD
jgi:hypothetical protein